MRTFMTSVVALLLVAGTVAAQNESIETFNAIRLENGSNPGNAVTLASPSGTVSYTLTLPATTAPTDRRYSFSLDASDGALSWYGTPYGSLGEIPYFSSDEELTGSPKLLWDYTTNTMLVSGKVAVGADAANTSLDVQGDVAFREYAYTGSMSGTMNNVDFTGNNNDAAFIYIGSTTTGEVQFTGFKGGASGKLLMIYNGTANPIRLRSNNTSSSAANRISTAGGQDLMLISGAHYQFIYSATAQRWIAASSNLGDGNWLGTTSVTLASSTPTLPSSANSLLLISAPNAVCDCTVSLQNGVTTGQILFVQNLGPKRLNFATNANIVLDNNTALQSGESIPFIWDGSKWRQLAEAAN